MCMILVDRFYIEIEIDDALCVHQRGAFIVCERGCETKAANPVLAVERATDITERVTLKEATFSVGKRIGKRLSNETTRILAPVHTRKRLVFAYLHITK